MTPSHRLADVVRAITVVRSIPAARHSVACECGAVDLPLEPVIANTFCDGGSARCEQLDIAGQLHAARYGRGNGRMPRVHAGLNGG
jgi:hypothetical protein